MFFCLIFLEYKTNETHARAFLPLNISAVGSVYTLYIMLLYNLYQYMRDHPCNIMSLNFGPFWNPPTLSLNANCKIWWNKFYFCYHQQSITNQTKFIMHAFCGKFCNMSIQLKVSKSRKQKITPTFLFWENWGDNNLLSRLSDL